MARCHRISGGMAGSGLLRQGYGGHGDPALHIQLHPAGL